MHTHNQANAESASAKPTWSPIFAMALSAFALVSSEFMPVSLLTPIAQDLGITEGMAGQSIAVSGAFALLTSLFISNIARVINRKTLLLVLTVMMIFSGTVVVLAPNFTIFLAGRAFIGIAIGGFWSLSAATALKLVPESRVPRALAIINGGNALAMVLAAPLGSFFGALIGWRGAFFCIVPVAALATVWLFLSLPAMKHTGHETSGNVFRLMKRASVATGMIAVSIFFMGQFSLFTYLRPFLETVVNLKPASVSFELLIIGASGFLGTVLIGRYLGKSLYQTLIIIPVIMAVIAVMLIQFGHSSVATTLLLAFWGLVATAAPVGWWTWLARTLPEDADAGGGLMVAIIQLAITIGATLGGMAFDSRGYQATFTLSSALLVIAAVLAFITARYRMSAAEQNFES